MRGLVAFLEPLAEFFDRHQSFGAFVGVMMLIITFIGTISFACFLHDHLYKWIDQWIKEAPERRKDRVTLAQEITRRQHMERTDALRRLHLEMVGHQMRYDVEDCPEWFHSIKYQPDL